MDFYCNNAHTTAHLHGDSDTYIKPAKLTDIYFRNLRGLQSAMAYRVNTKGESPTPSTQVSVYLKDTSFLKEVLKTGIQ